VARPKANIKPIAQPSSSNSPVQLGIDDPEFFQKITQQLQGRNQKSKHVLLNIPIWGWTGDGKTCALLTAIHYCDPGQHPLGLALITNTNELVSLESEIEEYRGLNLAGTAISTTERLRALSDTFIDDNDWPPGTDEPSSYILAVRNIKETLGYVLFPDLRGGSYRELDEAARNVLQRAHAAALLINPETYQKRTTDGKRYRDEILATLQGFSEANVPVCLMITKADLYPGQDEAADKTYQQLTILVDQQKTLKSLVCRVSVVGTAASQEGSDLPDAANRHPENMLKAWIWVVAQAFDRTVEDIRRNLPLVNLNRTGSQTVEFGFTTISELRQIGDFSGSPGRVICASSDDPQSKSFTFLSEDGELLETTFATGEQPQFRSVGQILEWEPSDVRCDYIGGAYLLGSPSNCNFVWYGTKGGDLSKTSFPFEMASWVPMSSRRILGVDASGRLHSLRYSGGRWTQDDFVEGFIEPSDLLTCAFVERSSYALVFNGQSVEGISVVSEGGFGTRVSPAYVSEFDNRPTLSNRLGLCLGISEDGSAKLSGPEKTIDLGPIDEETSEPFALASTTPLIAVVRPDLQVVAVSVLGSQVKTTSAEHSPKLHAVPQSMIWTPDGSLLAVSFDDKTWRVYRPFGL